MKMIVLAAGKGARMGNAGVAKCALPAFGRSVLDHVIGAGIRCGIDDFVVVRSHLDVPQIPGVRYHYCTEQLNMLHSLFCAADELTGPVVISYADIVYEHRILQELLDTPGEVCVTVDADFERYFGLRSETPESITETLVMRDGRIVAIGAPVDRMADAEAQYVGLLKFSEEGVRVLRDTYADLVEHFAEAPWRSAANIFRAPMTDMLQELVDRGRAVVPSVVHNGWIELDTPTDYGIVAALQRGEHFWLLNRDHLAGRPVVSAGGLPIRQGLAGPEALFVGSGEATAWRIPKGMMQLGESIEAAAIREVAEETGYRCRIRTHLGTARWPYYYEEQLYEELVHFFAMEPLGEMGARDTEHAATVWHPLAGSDDVLLYESERAIARAAVAMGP